MSINQTRRSVPAFTAITKRNGKTRLLRRGPDPFRLYRNPVPVADPVTPDPAADDFYDRLQRIWDRVLLLEDLGVIRTEFDKFRYAYQLAEAELQELCLTNAAAHPC